MWLFVEMESKYGILPNPKYDVYQDSYYHLMDDNAPAWTMPAAVRDVAKADACMTYWCYLSESTTVPAFYETTVKAKRLDAPEDSEMLDIVLDSIRYEISTVTNLGILDVLTGAASGAGLASNYAKRKSSINSNIKSLIKKYDRLIQKQSKQN